MTPRLIPFRYKLTMLIAGILVLLLVLAYLVVSGVLERRMTVRVETDLQRTTAMVRRLFAERLRHLENSTRSVAGHKFVFEIFTDETLDAATRNDLIADEILRVFRRQNADGSEVQIIDLALVAGADGAVLAGEPTALRLAPRLIEAAVVKACLESGAPAALLLQDGDRCLQIMVRPWFLGDELLGAVCVGVAITRADMQALKELSGVDLGFRLGDGFILATAWASEEEAHAQRARQLVAAMAAAPVAPLKQTARRVVLGRERFLFALSPIRQRPTQDAAASAPLPLVTEQTAVPATCVLLKSLDRELAFVGEIRLQLVVAGAIGAVVAVIIGYLFSLKITRPIATLRAATREVEQGNYEHQFEIASNDEFQVLGGAFQEMTRGLLEKERIRNAMDKVVSKEIADEMLKGDIKLGGEERIATILFCDIRKFTALSEGMAPDELLALLNNYFTRMSFCVDAHAGVIDKFVGDELMALFGVPVTHEDDALRGINSALDMLNALAQFNRATGRSPVNIGIGINTGPLIAGNMGAENRLNYTVLGDAVNLASRLEGMCKLYGVSIVVSDATMAAATAALAGREPPFFSRELDIVQVVGKSEGVPIHQILPAAAAPEPALLARFDEGRQLLMAEKISKSLQLFAELHSAWPDDGPTKLFFDRCRRYSESPLVYRTEYIDRTFIADQK
jgi:adenylate cyclase